MYERILVALDGSEPSQAALTEAIGLARQSPHGILRLLAVVAIPAAAFPIEGGDELNLVRRLRATAEQVLRDAEERVRSSGLQVESGAIEKIGGSIADAIVAEAWRWNAHLIVLGTHGRSGFHRIVLGSVAEGVARTAGPPVLLVHAPADRSQESSVALGDSPGA